MAVLIRLLRGSYGLTPRKSPDEWWRSLSRGVWYCYLKSFGLNDLHNRYFPMWVQI